MSKPGRPKGSRVVACKCGRRHSGKPGTKITCPCNRKLTVPEKAAAKKPPKVFL